MQIRKDLLFLIVFLCAGSWTILSWTPAETGKNPSVTSVAVKKEVVYERTAAQLIEQQTDEIYANTHLEESGLDRSVFEEAYIGYLNAKNAGKATTDNSILSIADFNLSSKKKRLWIIDVANEQLLLQTWVSHGQGSGGDRPTRFSNTPNSHQSSIGFYLTGETYYGKHGRSLRLDGLDDGFNSRARERAIVIHGADYVSQQAIDGLNRLGRSFGCPAVPRNQSDHVIDLVKNKTILYIHADQPNYHSVLLDKEKAGQRLWTAMQQDSIVENDNAI